MIGTGLLNRLKTFIAKSSPARGLGPGGGKRSPAAMALSLDATGGAALFAAKKRKRRKKAPAAVRSAPKKARRKPSSPEKTERPSSPAARVDGFFVRWRDHFAAGGYGSKDWGRLLLLVCGMLVVLYFSFSAGGYFVVKRGYGELVILYLLVMALIFSLRVAGGLTRAGRALIAFFGCYSLWILLSTTWSLSPADSLVEFNRAMLYLAGFLLFCLLLARREWLGWLAALFVALVAVVAIDGLLLKTFPDFMADYFNVSSMAQQIVSTTGVTEDVARLQALFLKVDSFQTNRLSYPLTYWNTMGLMMIMAAPLSLRLAADRMKPLLVRCLNAAVLVLFAAVVYFTFSRAGYLLLVFIVLLYTLLAAYRLRVALHAGLLALWTALLIMITSAALPAMVATQPSFDDRIDQGHSLGLLILVLLVLAVVAQVIVARFEGRVILSPALAEKVGIGLAVLGVAAAVGGFTAITASSGGPIAWLREQVSGASQKTEAVSSSEERIFSLQSERYDEYKVSLNTLADNPLRGTGSGTWDINWLRERPYEISVKDGHSWMFETMAELGLVGFLLLAGFVAAFVTVAAGYLRRLGLAVKRGHHSISGDLYAAVFVTCAAMLLHSLIDWDWEMPAVTLPFFMFAGALLRYGSLDGDGGEGKAAPVTKTVSGVKSSAAEAEEKGLAANWWVWVLAIGCLLIMALTVLQVFSETRYDAAQQRLRQGAAFAVNNSAMKAASAYIDASDIASGARKYDPLDARMLVQMGDANRGRAEIAVALDEQLALYDAAEADYLEALKLQPDNYQIYQKLAEIYLRSAQTEKAAEALRRVRELNPRETLMTLSLEERVRALGGY